MDGELWRFRERERREEIMAAAVITWADLWIHTGEVEKEPVDMWGAARSLLKVFVKSSA